MRVLLIGITTACGRISPAGMNSGLDRQHLETMRAETGASLMGAETLRTADPEMRGPAGALDKKRIRAIITQSGMIPVADRKLFRNGPPPLVFTGKSGAEVLTPKLSNKARIIVLPAGPDGLSIAAALSELTACGVDSVLIEGGGRLNYAALKQKVVDEISLTIAPYLSGDRTAVSFVDGKGPLADLFLPLEMISCRPAVTGEIFVSYRVKKE